MLEKWRVKKGDTVIVTTGKDSGKIGEVILVNRTIDKIIVKGVNIVKRHQKPSMTNAGGIVEKESFIHVSNVMHVDPRDNKPTRIGVKILEDGRKVRYAKRSTEQIDK